MRVRVMVPPGLAVLLTVTLSTVVSATPATAAAAPAVSAVRVIGDGPGDPVFASGSGFAAGTDVAISLDAATGSAPLATATPDTTGAVQIPAGTRIPSTAAPGVDYRVTMSQPGGATASSASFTLAAPAAVFPTRLQPGRPATAPAASLSITLTGLASGDDAVRTVSIDGTPTPASSYDIDGTDHDPGITFAVPATLPVGDHEVTFTQTGATPYTVTRTVPVPAPTVTVTGLVAPTMPYGTPVTFTDFGWYDAVDVTVVGAGGDRHTESVGSSSDDLGTFSRSLRATGFSAGRGTLTAVSRHNGASATTPFVVDGPSVTAPGGLAPGQRIVVANGFSQLLVQTDGNLVFGDFRYHPYWSTRTAGHPGAHLAVQSDGNVVLYDVNGKALWNTGTAGIGAGARLGFDANGDLAVSTATGRRAFAYYALPPPDTAVLTANHYLFKGQVLNSSATSGEYPGVTLTLQGDGNVVLHAAGRGVLWSARTSGHPNTYLVLQADGNLVVHAANGTVLWANYAKAAGARLVTQGDGNLVEYASNGKAVWSTRTGA